MSKLLTTMQATTCLSTAIILGGFVSVEFGDNGKFITVVSFHSSGYVEVTQSVVASGRESVEHHDTHEAYMLAYGVAS